MAERDAVAKYQEANHAYCHSSGMLITSVVAEQVTRFATVLASGFDSTVIDRANGMPGGARYNFAISSRALTLRGTPYDSRWEPSDGGSGRASQNSSC